MPLYIYTCEHCNEEIEIFKKIKDTEQNYCKKCSNILTRKPTIPSMISSVDLKNRRETTSRIVKEINIEKEAIKKKRIAMNRGEYK